MDLPEHDAHGAMPSARRDRSVVVDGWFASHADSGTPGPHLRLRASDFEDLVIRTDQVPMLCALLTAVAERIDAQWAVDGEAAAAEIRAAPDPQDPEVERASALARLRFVAAVGERADEVLALVRAADSTDEAVDSVAALLDADPVDVLVRLARFNLLGLTRPATERRWQLIDGE